MGAHLPVVRPAHHATEPLQETGPYHTAKGLVRNVGKSNDLGATLPSFGVVLRALYYRTTEN